MKIKSLFTCMMVSLVTILPLQAQVGKEMKAFRNKDGITVTMLNPSLYSLYKQGDLSLSAEEALKDIKEINVMQVDMKRTTSKVVEEISQRITPIVENEAKYTLVRSHRGAYSQEHLYVTQHEELSSYGARMQKHSLSSNSRVTFNWTTWMKLPML